MVVYELECKLCNHSYIGKTQNHFKKRTMQHIYDSWKVLEAGRSKYGDNWRGSGGYGRADAFAKHFADHFRTSNEVKSRIKDVFNLVGVRSQKSS